MQSFLHFLQKQEIYNKIKLEYRDYFFIQVHQHLCVLCIKQKKCNVGTMYILKNIPTQLLKHSKFEGYCLLILLFRLLVWYLKIQIIPPARFCMIGIGAIGTVSTTGDIFFFFFCQNVPDYFDFSD